MDFVLQQEAETFDYRHKKFDQRKRSREEEEHIGDEAEFLEIDVTDNTTNQTPSRQWLSVEHQSPVAVTPLSISSDSNSSTDVLFMSESMNGTSTPLQKRRKLWPTFQPHRPRNIQQSQHDNDDSGIALTPQRHGHNVSTWLAGSNTPLRQPLQSRQSLQLSARWESGVQQTTQRPTKRPRFATTLTKAEDAVPPCASTEMPKAAAPSVVAVSQHGTDAAAAVMPEISDETLRSICKYHGNMVRQFPKKQRTLKDQERRNKNTLACRMSRRVKKLESIAIEEQYKKFADRHLRMAEQTMRSAAYLNKLIKLVAMGEKHDSNGTPHGEKHDSNGTPHTNSLSSIATAARNKRVLADIPSPAKPTHRLATEAGTPTTRKKSFSIAFLMGDKRGK